MIRAPSSLQAAMIKNGTDGGGICPEVKIQDPSLLETGVRNRSLFSSEGHFSSFEKEDQHPLKVRRILRRSRCLGAMAGNGQEIKY